MRASKSTRRISGLMVGMLAAAAGGDANATALVDERFADGDRTTQAPPASLRWTSGAHHATAASAFTSLTVTNGQLAWDHSNNGQNSFSAVWGHFTAGGDPVALAVGQTLRLTFDVSFAGGAFSTSSNTFRFQLMNSNNSRVTADFAGTSETGVASGTTFGPWRGYEATLPVNTSTNTGADLVLRERTGTGNGLNTSANWTNLANGSVAEPLFAAGQTYSGLLEVTRTAAGVTVQGGIGGALTPVAADTSNPVTSFDTVSFFAVDSLSHNITLDNIQVAVVPEPGVGALLLAGAVRWAGRRRRR